VSPRFIARPAWALAIVLWGGLIVWCRAQESSSATTPPVSNAPLPSGLVIQQADTIGQIYIAGDRPGEEEEPAKNVLVRVAIPENDEIIYETRSDKNGGYMIPRLKPGVYRLHVGGLRIALLVDASAPSNAQLPKVVITILPRDLTRRQ
jgi:hypothetical protein